MNSYTTPEYTYKEKEVSIQKRHSVPMCISVIFTITNAWNQKRCQTTDEWTKEIKYMYILIHP
jgi:hypothetical protein